MQSSRVWPTQPDTWVEVEPDLVWTVRHADMLSRSGWTPFDGWALRGRVQRVTLRGECVYENGQIYAKPGSGGNLAPAYRNANKS
jgi:dihydroorotase-like cyclic amidohydrolase